MTSIESRSYCRVVVIAPSTRVDLALPADVSIIDMLPMLLQYAGEMRDDGGGQHGGWKLVRVGHGEVDGGRTLRSLDVADGEVLRLVPREERTVVPVFDDIVDAIATTRRGRINSRSINPGVGAAVIIGAMVVAALTLLERGNNVVDAYIAGGAALALLGLGSATMRGTGDRIVATATGTAALPFALVCGLNAVPGSYDRWGVLLGAALALLVALLAVLMIGTGTVVFAAAATTALLTALSALIAGVTHVGPTRVIAGTAAVALAALALLPRLAVRLARLPLATVPTTSEDLQETDDVGDIDDVTARARLAGEYLTGTQIGCAVTIGFSVMALGVHASVMSIALAAVVGVAMALRARSVASLGGRIALVASGVTGGLLAGILVVLRRQSVLGLQDDHDTAMWLLVAEMAAGVLALLLTTARHRRRLAPSTMRLIDFFEAAVVVAVLPLAVGVMGLYDLLRHL